MIEIEEIDHALALARERAEHRRWPEVQGILEMLRDEVGSCGPELLRAIYVAETFGWEKGIAWPEIRQECLLAVNAEIVKVLKRTGREAIGRDAINRAKQEDAADRFILVRQDYRGEGDSAESVRRRIAQNHGLNFSRRSIQRDLQKIRERAII